MTWNSENSTRLKSQCFAALENLEDDDDDDDTDISKAWESIREDIIITLSTESLSYYELKQRKSWFYEECSELLDQRKQAKLQWLQNPSQMALL
jgi:hypothetical protein